MKQELMKLREEIERQTKDLRGRKENLLAVIARSGSDEITERALRTVGEINESLTVRQLFDKLCTILQDQTT